MTKDVGEILAAARLPEDTVLLCMRADLVVEHEALDTELEALLDVPSQKLGGNPRRAELAEKIRALETKMADFTMKFRVRAMPKRRWRQLVAAHPPREVNGELDPRDFRGVNSDTFFHPMVRASAVEPQLTDEQWTQLLGHTDAEAEQLEAEGRGHEVQDGLLTSRQFEQLYVAAWKVNRDPVSVPFSHAASRLTTSTAPA